MMSVVMLMIHWYHFTSWIFRERVMCALTKNVRMLLMLVKT